MVKLRVGKKSKSTAKDSGVVISEFKQVRRFSFMPPVNLRFLRSRRGAMIAVALILIIAATVAFFLWRKNQADKPVVTKISSESGYVDSKLDGLKSSEPTEDSTDEERILYYDQLQGYSELKEDYKTALDAFLKRADIRTSDLQYDDYTRVSVYYYKLGDIQGSIAATDKAIELLPKTSTQPGYDYDEMKALLEQGKKAIQQ